MLNNQGTNKNRFAPSRAAICRILLALLSTAFCHPMMGCFSGDESQVVEDFITETYGVTVSEPDSEGYITVTGRESVRPHVVVVARVTRPKDFPAASASVSAAALIKNATASQNDASEAPLVRGLARPETELSVNDTLSYYDSFCVSTLPECPLTSADDRCVTASDDTGSFNLRVTGESGELLTVNYINALTCRETTVIENKPIGSGIIGLEMFAHDMAIDRENDLIYVVGKDDANGDTIQLFDISSHAPITATSFSDIDDPLRVNRFDNSAGDDFLFIAGEDTAKVGAVATPGTLDTGGFYDLTDASGSAAANLSFGSVNAFENDDDPSCEGMTSDSYDRAFFADGEKIYFHEFDGAFDNGAPTTINTSSRTINLSELAFSISDGTRTYDVVDIPFVQLINDPLNLENSLYLVTELDIGGGATTFVFFKVDTNDIDFCGANVFSAANGVDIGSDSGGLAITIFNGKGIYSNSAVFMGFLKKTSQEIILLDTQTFADIIDYSIDYNKHSATDGAISYRVNITEAASAIAGFGRLTDEIEELLVFGDVLGSSDFLVYNNVDSALELSNPQYAYVPVNKFYFAETDPFIVLDSAISEDENDVNYSYVRFYDLGSE